MIAFGKMTIKDRIFRLVPAYRRKQDEELLTAIKRLINNPDEACIVDCHYIQGKD